MQNITINHRLILYPLLALSLSPILYYFLEPLTSSLQIIENAQLFLLLAGSAISIRLAVEQKSDRLFWLWAALWWILLFGRSINWGRLYFPGFPREYYRLIGLFISLMLLLPWFITQYRQSLMNIVHRAGIPYKILMMLAAIFLMVDQVEQNRMLFQSISSFISFHNTELLEEIIESFFIIGLFECIIYYRTRITNSKQDSQICFNIENYRSH